MLDRKWMPEWPLSVTTIFPIPFRKQVFFHLEWTPSTYESKRTESKWPKSQWKSPNGSEHPPVLLVKTPLTAAAAKLLQLCPILCDPIDGSPPGSPVPGILQARTLEWVAISFSNAWKWKVKVKSLSGVWLLATPWTAAYQAPLSMGFSRQEYWSGLPLPSPTPLTIQP